MSQEPMFYQGQAVRCVQRRDIGNWGSKSPLIEGKRYLVEDPDYIRDPDTVFVTVYGIPMKAFDQLSFVPEEDNDQLESEIFESLKGIAELKG